MLSATLSKKTVCSACGGDHRTFKGRAELKCCCSQACNNDLNCAGKIFECDWATFDGVGGGKGGKQESGTFELLLASLRSTITVHAQVSRQSAEHCLFIKLCLCRIHQADMHSGPKCRKTLSYFSAESAHAFLYDAGNCFTQHCANLPEGAYAVLHALEHTKGHS